MKLDYIKDQSNSLADLLSSKSMAVREMELALAEARETEQRERLQLNEVLVELEHKQNLVADAEAKVQETSLAIEEQEYLNQRLRKEIEELEKRKFEEQHEGFERQAELGKARKEEIEAYHELQEIKGNVRVCIRIRPDNLTQKLSSSTLDAEEQMLEYNKENSSIKLTMPRSVGLFNTASQVEQHSISSRVQLRPDFG